ncbi:MULTISPECIES: TIGR00730 family Rossman fold protein [unclassified Pseudovibrio]|uniref:LOG family protein n=1 Tax=unclassified Pseudovibrio TaxID=2627060 RepID=UPI0007AE824A|nr:MULTISPECIES: TIGR00730 family Rossman fold protein [unclassified Pseudovibrio]KZK92475.1 LOG family protein YvdD [Pseudovibrio sp. W74]KZL08630.1 LOG family protein YvdD [Pseudovibrio sp. Ad14]KZL24913.1 LOG family protein YvdD [Pseudovibrio sp. Ad37]KZL25471.1 LOG family protein YvdD [Pseudovibrio sp. WM33]
MKTLKSICVYCGSNAGSQPLFEKAAIQLGELLAREGIRLVYGGGSIGLMGAVAKTVLENGGEVTGVIPKFLMEREVMLEDAHELIVTQDMHERKRTMFEKADAFIALPGGIGTLEELVEMLTWAQLGRHDKPMLLLNLDQFWTPLVELLDHMRSLGFIRPDSDITYEITEDVAQSVDILCKAIEGCKVEHPDLKDM